MCTTATDAGLVSRAVEEDQRRNGRHHALRVPIWRMVLRVAELAGQRGDCHNPIAAGCARAECLDFLEPLILGCRPGELRHKLIRIVWLLVTVRFLPVR